MTITKHQANGKLVLTVEGRLDTTTAPDFQTKLMPEFDAGQNIELDFKELVYISSAGLRVLVLGEKTAKAKGAAMKLVNVSPEVMEVLEMTGFTDILTIE
jgi:anti-anti-sigma factor